MPAGRGARRPARRRVAPPRAPPPAGIPRVDRPPVAAVAERQNLVYGLHAVGALLERAPERLLEIWLAQGREDARMRELKELAGRSGAHVHLASPEVLVKLVGDAAHQGAVAAVRPLAPWDDRRLVSALSQMSEDPLLLVLDGVTDPHNLGACLRTAEAAGAQAVVIPTDRAAPVNEVARKVAAGAAELVPVASVTNLARAIDRIKECGVWVVGADGQATDSLYDADLNRPLALVLGAEGAGMRRLTRERCDFLVRIPMMGQIESLNVSVAAGVALFEARRQRSGKREGGRPR